MLCEKIMLQCGHKLRMKVFQSANQDGLCPLFECRCPLTTEEQKEVSNQVILWNLPMWQLKYGRPATNEECEIHEAQMSKRPKLMERCKGTTMAGKPCTCTAMRSNGLYCNKHVSQQIIEIS